MTDYSFELVDFEHPSFLFVLEDKVKGLLGIPFLYNPYIKGWGLNGDEKVLDFGCGGGVSSRCIAGYLKRGGSLTCVDTSNYWIKKAGKRLARYANVECLAGDIRELDIADDSFDVIAAIHVIHDIPPAERPATVKALAGKLKVGGKAFIWEPTKQSHGIAVSELRELFSAAGLREVSFEEKKSAYKGRYEKTAG